MPSPSRPTEQEPLPAGRRIIALWFPYWAAETAAAKIDATQPFALVGLHKGAQRLVGLTAAAEQLGLTAAMPLADARALVPNLQTAMHDATAATEKLEQCAHWLQRYTPWVGHDSAVETAHGLTDYGLLMDVSGCAHLFGGARALLQDMAVRFEKRGVTLRAAMAGSVGAAWGLARFAATGLTVLPPGQEAEAVLALPPAALRLTPPHVDLCDRLGLDTVAHLARFPRADLTRRFGPQPVLRLEQALGQAGESLNPCLPPPQFLVRRNLPQGITQLDALAVLLAGLCDELAAQLQAAGQGAQRLDVMLTRSDNAVLALSVTLAHPSADAAHLARLFADRLERLSRGVDAGYGIEQIRLLAARTAPLSPGQDVMGLAAALGGRLRQVPPVAAFGNRVGDAVGDLVDRLVGRLGGASVVRPVLQASHVPENAVRLMPVLSPYVADDIGIPPEPATRPLFMLCAPEPIEVIAEIPEGAPYRFRWRRVLHEITAAQGPERIAPEWWQGLTGEAAALSSGRSRDYYRVEDTQGHRFWLYRDGLYGRETARPRWFMHGVFP